VDHKEEKLQKFIKSTLNKLSPDNFERLLSQLLSFKYTKVTSIDEFATQIFEKAILEPTFCEMYTELVRRLSSITSLEGGLPVFQIEEPKTGKIFAYSLKRAIVIKCQAEFERGRLFFSVRDTTYNNHEHKKIKQRTLGNIRFIGQLYRHRLLTRSIINKCISLLIKDVEDPIQEDVEAMCKLVAIVGQDLENPLVRSFKSSEAYESAVCQGVREMDKLISKIEMLHNNQKLETRLQFMCRELLELRLNCWDLRRKTETPKIIENTYTEIPRMKQYFGLKISRSVSLTSS
jgi:translation initiation factor 4G